MPFVTSLVDVFSRAAYDLGKWGDVLQNQASNTNKTGIANSYSIGDRDPRPNIDIIP